MADYSVGKFVGPLVGLMIGISSRHINGDLNRFVGLCPYKAQSSSAHFSESSLASLCPRDMSTEISLLRCSTSSPS